MSQLYKCSCCQDTVSFDGRSAAILAGWTFVEAASKRRIKYWVICPKHQQLAWLKAALEEERREA